MYTQSFKNNFYILPPVKMTTRKVDGVSYRVIHCKDEAERHKALSTFAHNVYFGEEREIERDEEMKLRRLYFRLD